MTSKWHGTCDLRLFKKPGSRDIENVTTIHQAKCQAPLKIMKVFNNKEDGRCEVPILHSAGGIVGGDQLTINVNAEENSRAICSSVAAQKALSIGKSVLTGRAQGFVYPIDENEESEE